MTKMLHRGLRFMLRVCLVCLIAATLPALQRQASADAPRVQFNRDVRPLLAENCFACHGPDRNKRQADLRLDLRSSALERGVIVPGHPEKSPLVARIMSGNSSLLMPPAASHRSLDPAQRALLARWIKQGAEYQAHWAYILPAHQSIPVVTRAKSRVQNPIDAFIFSRLEQKGILPSPEADRRTLLRRLTLDLIGLPPTPQELQAFLADRSPDAYEKVVDRLLRSPRYGERMAVPWLDVVRYADTVGFHGDQNQNAWPYRDYVINAFNSNKPYDQFTREQLAGDLLPNPTLETRTATCFIRLTMMTREGGAQPKEYLAKYAADRVRTVGMAWLGSTLGCCECHDHKYDPFSTKDFYSMASFFADVKQWGVYEDYDYTPNPELRGINNDSPFPPEIKVVSPYLQARMTQAREQLRRIALGTEPKQTTDRAAYDAWRDESAQFLATHPDGYEGAPLNDVQILDAKEASKSASNPPANPAFYTAQTDGSLLLTSDAPANAAIRFRPQSGRIAALHIDLLRHAANGGAIYRAGGGPGTLLVNAYVHRADGSVQPIAFRHGTANYAEPRYSNGFEIIGLQHGWRLSDVHAHEAHHSTWTLETPLKLNPGDRIAVAFNNVKLGCIRLSTSPFVPQTPDLDWPSRTLREALVDPVGQAKPEALLAYLESTAWNADAFAQIKTQEADYLACRDGVTPVMVAEAVKPPITRVLPRGNWQNESGEIVEPAVPHFLPQPQHTPGTRLTRLDLANWIVSPENPLTARVFVNRLWKQFFGFGLSDTVDDLGVQGELPSHPELLDWLAIDFREHAWNIKRVVKQIVMSSTYRQSSRPRPELRNIDPGNRLLAGQNPRRLDAEFVRDNALAIAGLLTTDLGGPPCKPYQPAGYYANIQFPDRDYIADRDDREWRRGVYMHWQRTFLQPMLANFGAPSREDCIAARTVANTPQQALTLLNDPEFVEAARVLAAHLLAASASTDAARLERAYVQALARAPKPNETQSLLTFLHAVRQAYHERPEDAKLLLHIGYAPTTSDPDTVELASWTSVCRVILNLHETITRY